MKAKLKHILTEEFLRQKYVVDKKSVHEIKYELGLKSTNSITQYLKKFNITRPNLRDRSHITYDILHQKYIIENKSLKNIAKELGLSNKGTIKRLLVQHNIPLRQRSYKTPLLKISWTKKKTGYEEINGRYWQSIKHGAERRRLEFSITIEEIWQLYIQQNKQCALSGVPICFKQIGDNPNVQTASLDRIDSSKGYIKGNIQWVHKQVNTFKMDMSTEELLDWCKKIINHHKEP